MNERGWKARDAPITHGVIARDLHMALGLAVDAMAKSDDYCQYPIACVTLWIEPAIRHEQIHFFRDESGKVCGYMTWAWLAEDAERRLLHDPNVLLHISEWNEGDRLWILDFLVHTGEVRMWIREARDLFGGVTQANSLRRRSDGSIRKVTAWKRRLSRNTSQPMR
jgi:cytolysin-activating lysine-acyltransferase